MMFKHLILILCALLWTSLASAQIVLPGGGGGGGGGSVTANTTCPTSTQTGSTLSFANSLNDLAKTGTYPGSWTTDCGAWVKFTCTAACTYTLPAPSADGNYVAMITNTATSSNALTIAAGSGTINGGASISLAINASISVACDATNCYAATVQPANPVGGGYAVGPWYTPWYTPGSVTGTVAQSATTMYCIPWYIANINPLGGGSGTLGTIDINITTLSAGGNTQIALYNNSATDHPGTLVANTASISTAATGHVTAALSASVVQGQYWECQETDNATVRFTVFSNGLTKSFLTGNASSNSVLVNTTAAVSTPSTFGTWPNLTAATFTDISAVGPAFLQFQFASIP